MRLAETVALSALFLLLAAALTSGRALGEPSERAKALAEAAASDSALKKLQTEDERRVAELRRVKAAEARKAEAARLCHVRPVMTDGDIVACRVAYRGLGEAAD